MDRCVGGWVWVGVGVLFEWVGVGVGVGWMGGCLYVFMCACLYMLYIHALLADWLYGTRLHLLHIWVVCLLTQCDCC